MTNDHSPVSTPPRTIGILHHPRKPESAPLASLMGDFIQASGCTAWLDSAWDESGIIGRLHESPELDMLITLGGDGTMLRAARMGASAGIPILGVKMGRLGFLAEVEPEEWQAPLQKVLAGQYWLERRLMVDVRLQRNSEDIDPGQREAHFQALNEVVVSRGRLARIVRVSTWIDGDFLTTYAADGVIVATPTGSTGYALAAGGPILPPELRNILVVPIAPHLSLDRALVLSEGEVVKLEVVADHQIILSVDGQFDVEVQNGDTIEVKASNDSANFVRVRRPSYFYRNLMQRLKWNL